MIQLLGRARRTLYIFDPMSPEHSNASLADVLRLGTVAVLTDHAAFKDVRGPKVLRWNRA